jgi:hypothetical protein
MTAQDKTKRNNRRNSKNKEKLISLGFEESNKNS